MRLPCDSLTAARRDSSQAGEFSRELLRAASAAVADVTAEDLEAQHKGEVPLKLLQAAERGVRSSGVEGSSTVCITCIDGPRVRPSTSKAIAPIFPFRRPRFPVRG